MLVMLALIFMQNIAIKMADIGDRRCEMSEVILVSGVYCEIIPHHVSISNCRTRNVGGGNCVDY